MLWMSVGSMLSQHLKYSSMLAQWCCTCSKINAFDIDCTTSAASCKHCSVRQIYVALCQIRESLNLPGPVVHANCLRQEPSDKARACNKLPTWSTCQRHCLLLDTVTASHWLVCPALILPACQESAGAMPASKPVSMAGRCLPLPRP